MNAGQFKSGELHPRWSGGLRVTSDGYLRFSSGEFVDRYYHRVVVETLPGPLALNRRLRPDEHVHHQCHNRQCRNPEHWIVMPKALHIKGHQIWRR